MPIGNGIFNANSLKEAEEKYSKCTLQAIGVINNFLK